MKGIIVPESLIRPVSSKPGRPRPLRRFVFFFSLTVGTILLLLFGLFLGYCRHREQRIFSNMSPELRADFERWYHEKVTIPPEILQIPSFSSETIEAVRTFDREWTVSRNKADELFIAWQKTLSVGTSATAPLSPSLLEWRPRLEPVRPLLRAWRTVVMRPDYRIQLWLVPERYPEKDSLDFESDTQKRIDLTARLVALDARILLEEHREKEALENAETLLAAAQLGTCYTAWQRLSFSSIVNKGLDTYVRILANLTDPALKQQARLTLEKYRKSGVFGSEPPLDLMTFDWIAMAREACYRGLTPDFQGKTGPEILEESCRVQRAYVEQYILPKAQSSLEIRNVENALNFLKTLTNGLDQSPQKSTGLERIYFEKIHARNQTHPKPNGLERIFSERIYYLNMGILFESAAPTREMLQKLQTRDLRQYDLLIQNLTEE
jgi:hypothetical protein